MEPHVFAVPLVLEFVFANAFQHLRVFDRMVFALVFHFTVLCFGLLTNTLVTDRWVIKGRNVFDQDLVLVLGGVIADAAKLVFEHALDYAAKALAVSIDPFNRVAGFEVGLQLVEWLAFLGPFDFGYGFHIGLTFGNSSSYFTWLSL